MSAHTCIYMYSFCNTYFVVARIITNYTTHCKTLHHRSQHATARQQNDNAANCNTLQCTATQCYTLQHTATHCNIPASYCGRAARP